MKPELPRSGLRQRHGDGHRIIACHRFLDETDDLVVIDLREAQIAGLQQRRIVPPYPVEATDVAFDIAGPIPVADLQFILVGVEIFLLSGYRFVLQQLETVVDAVIARKRGGERHPRLEDPAWVFKARVALAATLSGNYGIYNGFELLEHEPIPGKEEYLNSDKYELKVRDWNRPGNIKSYIGRLNRIRRDNAALLQTGNLRFAQIDDNEVIGFIKESVARDNAVAVAVALTQAGPREFWFHFGDIEIGPSTSRRRVKSIENLITGEEHILEWGGVRLRIDPQQDPALLFRCFT